MSVMYSRRSTDLHVVEYADMAVRDTDKHREQTNTWQRLEKVLYTGPPAPDEEDPWRVNGELYNVLDLPRQRDELERVPRWR